MLLISILFLKISKKVKNTIKKQKSEYNIQPGKITYSDLNKPAKPFFSKKYRITGKPDYVTITNNNYIPIEFKTGKSDQPQKNHIFQLAAYCQLLEDNYGGFVPYGILVYNNNSQFKIPYDPKIRYELNTTINKMRHQLRTGKIIRNHMDSNKCNNCSMRTYCNFKLL